MNATGRGHNSGSDHQAVASDAALHPGPVLVTGAGSGIGLWLVQALLADGHRVYAGAPRPAHLEHLQALGAQALALDVRDAAQVLQAADTIAQAGHGLHAVVHNAGVGGMACWPAGPTAMCTSSLRRSRSGATWWAPAGRATA